LRHPPTVAGMIRILSTVASILGFRLHSASGFVAAPPGNSTSSRCDTGGDPAAELQAKMSALVDLYESEGCVIQRGKRQGEAHEAAHQRNTQWRAAGTMWCPCSGHERVFEINAGDIERFVADVTAGRTACDEKVGPRRRIIVRGAAGAARKVVRDLSAIFSFAIRSEILPRNPCESAAVRERSRRGSSRTGAYSVRQRHGDGGIGKAAHGCSRMRSFVGACHFFIFMATGESG
jgi:hypothetical protein